MNLIIACAHSQPECMLHWELMRRMHMYIALWYVVCISLGTDHLHMHATICHCLL